MKSQKVQSGLKNAGFLHLRYVDDIRIFCDNKLDAKRALLLLSELLRNRGLNVQSAKTGILSVAEARKEIDGVTAIIRKIERQVRDELSQIGEFGSDYATVGELRRAVEEHPESPPPEILEQAFKHYFLKNSRKNKFNKTLLHYLLTRLGAIKSEIARSYCITLLFERPEETEYSLRYLSSVGVSESAVAKIVQYCDSEKAIYDYQLYQILRWVYELAEERIAAEFLGLCRQWAYDANRDPWLRAYSTALLGMHGDTADLEQLEISYNYLITDLERAEVALALAKMEKGRRNSFYGRIRSDGEFLRRAIQIVKNRKN